MKQKPAVKKAPPGRKDLSQCVQTFLSICQKRRCFDALRHLLRTWPVCTTLNGEYEELLNSLRMVQANARRDFSAKELTANELNDLSALISRVERRLGYA